jgi:hypothetical protein
VSVAVVQFIGAYTSKLIAHFPCRHQLDPPLIIFGQLQQPLVLGVHRLVAPFISQMFLCGSQLSLCHSGMKTMGTMELSRALACFTANSRKLNKHHAAPFAIEQKYNYKRLSKDTTNKPRHCFCALHGSQQPSTQQRLSYWTIFNITEQDPDSVKYKGDLVQMKFKGQ